MSESIEELEKKKNEALSGDDESAEEITTESVSLDDYSDHQKLQCEIVEQEPEEPLVCPTCTPNPTAIVPDWTKMPTRTPVYTSQTNLVPIASCSDAFLNERTCEYSIVLSTKYEGTGGSDETLQERLNESIEPAIRALLRFYDRVESDGEAGTVEALKLYASASEYHIPPVHLLKMKVLVTIPALNFDEIPNALESSGTDYEYSDEEERTSYESSSDDIYVSYEPEELFRLISRIEFAFRVFNFQQAQFARKDGGAVIFDITGRFYDFNLQRQYLGDFLKSLNRFLSRRNYTKILPGVLGGTNVGNFSNKKILGNIDFIFGGNLELKSITLTQKWCDNETEAFPVALLSFAMNESWQDPTTMSYIARLKDMEADLIARDPIPWNEFVTKYTFPSVNISYGYGSGPSAPSSTLSGPGCFVDSLNFNEMAESLFSDVISMVDILAETWNEHLCMTPDQLKELQKQYTDAAVITKIAEETSKSQTAKSFTTAEELIGEFADSASTDFDLKSRFNKEVTVESLWSNVLDPVGWCGVTSMVNRSIDAMLCGLSFDDALQVIVRSAIDKMPTVDFGRVFKFLPADVQVELSIAVQEKMGMPDFITPWDLEEVDVSEAERLRKANIGDMRSVLGATTEAVGEIMIAYKDALYERYKDSLDELLDFLGKVPGADIVRTIISDPDCNVPPVLKLAEISGFNEFAGSVGFCKKTHPITFDIKKFNIFENTFERFGRDRFALMKSVLKDKIEKILVEIMINVIDKAMQALHEAVCNAVKDAAEAAFDNPGQGIGDPSGAGSFFTSLVRDSFCGEDATEEDINNTINELFSTLAGDPSTSPETINEFVSDISLITSPADMAGLFVGEENEINTESINNILDLVESNYPSLKSMFSGPRKVQNFFKHLNSALPEEAKQIIVNYAPDLEELIPAAASICSSKDQLLSYKARRISILQSKDDTTEEQASDLYCKHVDKLKEQLKDLLDSVPQLTEDPNSAFPSLSVPLDLFAPPPEPGCEDDPEEVPPAGSQESGESLEPQILTNSLSELNNSLIQSIKNQFDEDLIGRKGFLNMVLSDTNSYPFKKHIMMTNLKRRYIDYKGEFDELYPDGVGIMVNFTGKDSYGQYPLTIAQYLQECYGSIKDFTTLKSAEEITTAEVLGTTDIMEIPTFQLDEFGLPIIDTVVTTKEKTPDIFLRYRDAKDGDVTLEEDVDIPYDYGFNIEYSHYVPGSEYENVYRLKLIDINVESDNFRDDESESSSVFCDLTITGSIDSSVLELLSTMDPTRDTSKVPQDNILCQMVANSMVSSGFSQASPEDVYSHVDHNKLVKGHLSLIANDIYTFDEAFNFGFNTGSVVTKEDLFYYDPFVNDGGVRNIRAEGEHFYDGDTELLQPYGTYLSDLNATLDLSTASKLMAEAEILGISSSERVHFMDPKKYGGRYTRPPIYIEPREDSGWMGLAQILIPEADGCDPMAGDLIDFSDIADKIETIYLNAPEDPRLDEDPNCITEYPYFKMLDKMPAAAVEGSILATIRVYVVETMLKAMPVFGKYQAIRGDVIDDVFVEYIIAMMEPGLKEMGQKIRGPRNLLRGENYWYAFLEQCVQVYRRRVSAGEIEVDTATSQAINNIDEKLSNYIKPTRKVFREDRRNGLTTRRTFRRYKHDKIVEFLKETERDAKTIMRVLVYEQFEYVSSKFKEALKDISLSPTVDNLDMYYFFPNIQDVLSDVELMEAQNGASPVPGGDKFIIEKYVYVEPKVEITNFPTSPPSHVVNLKDWQNWIDEVSKSESDPEFADKNISSYFGNLTAIKDLATEDIIGVEGSIGVRYGLRLCYITSDTAQAEIIGRLEDGAQNVTSQERAYVPLGDRQNYVIPLAKVELDVTDAPLNTFIDVSGEFDSTYAECLMKDLAIDPNYLMVFKYIIPLPRLLALLGIYASRGFLPSIGQILGETNPDIAGNQTGTTMSGMKAEWQEEAKKARGLTYYKWDQETFTQTKKSTMKMFETYWNHREFPGFDIDLELKLDFKDRLREMMNFNFSGAGVKWTLRRRFTDRPFDKNGEECE